MRIEPGNMGNLVKALDDTRLFCRDVNDAVKRPSLKRLLERIAQTHQPIADELCERIAAAGGNVSRKGRALRRWRVAWSHWLAHSSLDIELAYAIQTARREDRLLRQFRGALQRTRDPGTRDRLALRLCELERTRMDIGRLVSLLEVRATAWLRGEHAATRIPRPVFMRQPAAQECGRLGVLRATREERNHGRQP